MDTNNELHKINECKNQKEFDKIFDKKIYEYNE